MNHKKKKLNKIFITFEGGEGAGKTSLIDGINENLLSKSIAAIKTREPGSTEFGEEVRDVLLKGRNVEISPYAEMCLFLASRAQHIKEVINPNLALGKIVLCDRFNDSTIAYQGHARGIGIEKVSNFCDFICEGVKPDLTIYLDIPPEMGLKRVSRNLTKFSSNDGLDRIEAESISFHQKIRDGFYKLARKEPSRFYIIDATLSKEIVLEKALQGIYERLENTII